MIPTKEMKQILEDIKKRDMKEIKNKEEMVEVEYCRFCEKPFKFNGRCPWYKGMLAHIYITECEDCLEKQMQQMRN